ncbi:MAG: hypothetical protein ACI9G5_000759, partial [Paracoccaceae bacterium]
MVVQHKHKVITKLLCAFLFRLRSTTIEPYTINVSTTC